MTSCLNVAASEMVGFVSSNTHMRSWKLNLMDVSPGRLPGSPTSSTAKYDRHRTDLGLAGIRQFETGNNHILQKSRASRTRRLASCGFRHSEAVSSDAAVIESSIGKKPPKRQGRLGGETRNRGHPDVVHVSFPPQTP